MNRNRGCAQSRSWFCITLKEQFPDKWPQVKFWPTAKWLDPNPTCCLFSSKCQLISLFLFFVTKTNVQFAHPQLERNPSWWCWLEVGQGPQGQVGLEREKWKKWKQKSEKLYIEEWLQHSKPSAIAEIHCWNTRLCLNTISTEESWLLSPQKRFNERPWQQCEHALYRIRTFCSLLQGDWLERPKHSWTGPVGQWHWAGCLVAAEQLSKEWWS